ncbi:methyltransferase domain-containing protein [Rhodanobacter sp. L36]|uniref:methyltransferase domain-containing protein n=1 Tax=Rhodanobacter sp. L36 TaxID=1747221 RepID=UPI00131B1A82|nr:methyltransferase domain-containing protein [Rhodanobacter sp. L36]
MQAQHARTHAEESLLSDLRLQCPRCGTPIGELDCPACSYSIVISDGIARALPPASIEHHARFIEDYERIRAAEGHGSANEDFYLGLPYRDTSGRNREQWRMRARSYDYLVRQLLNDIDRGGSVLDLGAGNGWMSFRLALAGFRPCAVDLLANDSDGLGAARHYRSQLPTLFPRFQAEIRHLPFADEQFDAAIFNASFHYAEDYEVALREAMRCVITGGMVIISDTPWYARDESGRQMLAERRASFLQRHGTSADSVAGLGYLTDERLHSMEAALSIRWKVHRPWYGPRWAVRPLMAKFRGRREPSKFRLYEARKEA